MDFVTVQNHCVFLATYLAFLRSSNAKTVDLKLSDGISPNQGYVEVRVSGGNWQPLRDGSLGNSEAEVVCRQLGFSHGTTQGNVYQTTIPDFRSEMYRCTGREKGFGDCIPEKGPSVSVDNIYYYAGVCCSNNSEFEERIGRVAIGHCSVTWQEALDKCEGRNMSFSSLPRDIPYKGSRYWIGQFFTPWIWSDGCVMLNGSHGKERTFPQNSPETCMQFCGDSPYSQFALLGDMCRCLGPTSNQEEINHTLPVHCDSVCSGNWRFRCGGAHEEYWSLFSIASDRDGVFYTVNNPRSSSQCAVLLTEDHTQNKLQSEECSIRKGYICSDTREERFAGFLYFGSVYHKRATLQDARQFCYSKAKNLQLSGRGIITSKTLTDRSKFHGKWVNIQRTVTAIQIQNANVSPSLCISINVTDGADELWLISQCKDRFLYTCSMLQDIPPVVEDIHTTKYTSTKSYVTLAPLSTGGKENKGLPHLVYIGIGVAVGLVICIALIVGICFIRKKRLRKNPPPTETDTDEQGYELVQRTSDGTERNMYDEIKDQDTSQENHFYQELEDATKEASLLNNSPETQNKQKLTEKISYVYPQDSVKGKHSDLQETLSRASTDTTKYVTPYDSLPDEKT